jgi:integrase/recombinase XerC
LPTEGELDLSTKWKTKPVLCKSCGIALPGRVRRIGRIDLCEDQACLIKALEHSAKRINVGPNEVKCAWPECDNYLPAGVYNSALPELGCSPSCYQELREKRDLLVCEYIKCARQFRGRKREGRRTFCCTKHRAAQAQEEFMATTCGSFRPLVEQYLEFAKLRVKTINTVRSGLALFCRFLQEENIADLESVGPVTITDFLGWGDQKKVPTVWNAIWTISGFMKWLIGTGQRMGGNPVVPRFHSRRKAKRLPRPYAEAEMAYIWRLLDERGDTVCKLAVAIGEETGLRISEIANVRLQDVDLEKQRLFVRLPNKTNCEGLVPFHDKTRRLAQLWLSERRSDVNHDHLLHDRRGRKFRKATLHFNISIVLCKSVRGIKRNETGLERWSTHRLRHTMASRLVRGGADASAIMAIGRWASFSSMLGYSQVDEETKSRGYHEAMERAKRESSAPKRVNTAFKKGLKNDPGSAMHLKQQDL